MTSRIHPTALIDAGAEIGEGVEIGAQAIVGEGCRIGDGSVISPRARRWSATSSSATA